MNREPVLAVRKIDGKPWGRQRPVTMKVYGGLHYLRGNSQPYFCLTRDLYSPGHKDSPFCCGAGHEDILAHCPQFADIAAMHLSGMDGTPMHAEANGWYDLAGALPNNAGERYHRANASHRPATPDECLSMFAASMRCSVDTAREVRDSVIAAASVGATEEEPYHWASGRMWFALWVEQQRPRWRAEADACIAHHNLKVFGDPWPDPEQ